MSPNINKRGFISGDRCMISIIRNGKNRETRRLNYASERVIQLSGQFLPVVFVLFHGRKNRPQLTLLAWGSTEWRSSIKYACRGNAGRNFCRMQGMHFGRFWVCRCISLCYVPHSFLSTKHYFLCAS